MSEPVAAGVVCHSGWCVMVTVQGPPARPLVVDRRRADLVAADLPGPLYHAARAMPLDEAERLVRRVEASARRHAWSALEALRADLGARAELRAVSVRRSGSPVPPTVAGVLASHPAMHTAEGALYRDVIRAAAQELDVVVHDHDPRLDAERAAPLLGTTPGELEAHLRSTGRALGPPWRKDHRVAVLAAALALLG